MNEEDEKKTFLTYGKALELVLAVEVGVGVMLLFLGIGFLFKGLMPGAGIAIAVGLPLTIFGAVAASIVAASAKKEEK